MKTKEMHSHPLRRNKSYRNKEFQAVIIDHSPISKWITCVIADRWVLAKVMDDPSEDGINNSRVIKLCVGKSYTVNKQGIFFKQLDLNYDRKWDFNNFSDEDVSVIIAALEKLPKTTA